MHDFEEMTNVPFEYAVFDDRLPKGTEFHPVKGDNAEGWVIIPPKEYLASDAKYDEFKSIFNDITIDFNIGLKPLGLR